MADKLQWLDRHPIFLHYQKVHDCVNNENYKIPDLASVFIDDNTSSTDYLDRLSVNSFYKEACEFLCYALHKRVALWWVYLCTLAKQDEITINNVDELPFVESSFDLPTLDDLEKDPEGFKEKIALAKKQVQKQKVMLREMFTDEFNTFYDNLVKLSYNEFEKVHGYNPKERFDKVLQEFRRPEQLITLSPNMQEQAGKLGEDLKNQGIAVVEAVKQALQKNTKASTKSLEAVYSFIVNPNEETAKQALDCANAEVETPEGLLAYGAFWCYGDLNLGKSQVIRVPAGLAANGLYVTLFKLASDPQGSLSLNERFALYLSKGLEIAFGHDSFAYRLAQGDIPHEKEKEDNNITAIRRFKW